MKRDILLIWIFAVLILLVAGWVIFRSADERRMRAGDKVVVSILPLKYLVDRITGGTIEVEVLVPPGSSPETYEPTPRQIVSVADAQLLFTTGLLDFEQSVIQRISGNTAARNVDLSEGLELIVGDQTHDNHIHSGVDPHIWSSPRRLKHMAEVIYTALDEAFHDTRRFERNTAALLEDLNKLEAEIEETLTSSGVDYFLIYHPALTYYADDYDIEQVSLEDEGKEPSADYLRSVVSRARQDGIKTILYQKEFSRSVVETIAADIGAQPVEIDPLAENVIENLREITHIITAR